jgi:hypothetical protein
MKYIGITALIASMMIVSSGYSMIIPEKRDHTLVTRSAKPDQLQERQGPASIVEIAAGIYALIAGEGVAGNFVSDIASGLETISGGPDKKLPFVREPFPVESLPTDKFSAGTGFWKLHHERVDASRGKCCHHPYIFTLNV